MKYVKLAVEVWRPKSEPQPWEDPQDLRDDDLEAMQLEAVVAVERIVYMLSSFRPGRVVVSLDDGTSLTVVGTLNEVYQLLYV